MRISNSEYSKDLITSGFVCIISNFLSSGWGISKNTSKSIKFLDILLDSDLFRRDQVWFVQKDEQQGSRLYSLLDFKPRKGEAIGKGYLQGRYGALPFIGKFRFS